MHRAALITCVRHAWRHALDMSTSTRRGRTIACKPLNPIRCEEPGLDARAQVGGVLPGGLAVRGLSGGERRRLSMACGVVGAPKIIYLDEPTSGLDGNAALVVMRCMGRLAAQQRIVVSSIHQPRAAIWELFSKVTVLSEGRMLYFGAISQVGPAPLSVCSVHFTLIPNKPPQP